MIFEHTPVITIIKSQRNLGAIRLANFMRTQSKLPTSVNLGDHHTDYLTLIENTLGENYNCTIILENVVDIPDKLKNAAAASGVPTILIEMSVMR